MQKTFANTDKLSPEIVAEAIVKGIERARLWKYPIQGQWTTSVHVSGFDFEIHQPTGGSPGVLNFKEV